jgi:hypothetical protein
MVKYVSTCSPAKAGFIRFFNDSSIFSSFVTFAALAKEARSVTFAGVSLAAAVAVAASLSLLPDFAARIAAFCSSLRLNFQTSLKLVLCSNLA